MDLYLMTPGPDPSRPDSGARDEDGPDGHPAAGTTPGIAEGQALETALALAADAPSSTTSSASSSQTPDFDQTPGPALEEGDLSSFQNIGQAPLLPPREPLGARLAALMGRHHALLLALSVALLWAITTIPSAWNGDYYQRGQVAPRDIVAPHDLIVPLLNQEEITARREEAANLVPPSYDPNPGAQSQALTELYDIVNAARRVTAPAAAAKGTTSGAGKDRVLRLKDELGRSLPLPLAMRVLSVPPGRWNTLEQSAANGVRAVYQGGQIRSDVLADDIQTASRRIMRRIERDVRPPAAPAASSSASGAGLTPAEAQLAMALARQVIRQPNLVVDERNTARAREQAQNAVRDLYQHIKADTVLVKSGEIITSEKYAQLQAIGLVAPAISVNVALAHFVLCLALVIFGASYLVHFQRSLMERPAALWLSAAVPIAFVALFRQVPHVPHADFTMVPLAAIAAMLLTTLLNARVGLIAGLMVAGFCAFMARTDVTLFLITATSAGIGAISMAEIASRTQLMLRAPVILTVTNGLLAAALGVLRGAPTEEVISLTIWGALAGVFSVVATAALAMFLERPFGITTHLRLLELLAPDELVMLRMQAEAPGTYTHSLMVAMLSETAAKNVGADPLLCRIGGLYHDIGKWDPLESTCRHASLSIL